MILRTEDFNRQNFLMDFQSRDLKYNTFANYASHITIAPLYSFILDLIYSLLENKMTLYEHALKIFQGKKKYEQFFS